MTGRWRSLYQRDAISLVGLRETLLGGQSFSWSAESENHWTGVIDRSVVQLRWADGNLKWRTSGSNPIGEDRIRHYLWLEDTYESAVDALPWRSDPCLYRAIQNFPGLRILRQPIDETLLVFLLSSAKVFRKSKSCVRKSTTY